MKLSNKRKLPFLSWLILIFSSVSCSQDTDVREIISLPYETDRGIFSYYVRGDLEVDKQGMADFYRAGTHVVIIFDSRTAPRRLELAYEETRSNHTGIFPVVQKRDPGGFLMYYKNGPENYWQREGDIEITFSNEDTIVGRMDQVRLSYIPEDPEDSVKRIEVSGHFEAY